MLQYFAGNDIGICRFVGDRTEMNTSCRSFIQLVNGETDNACNSREQ